MFVFPSRRALVELEAIEESLSLFLRPTLVAKGHFFVTSLV